METSTPRAGSQLAPTVARHSAPYRAEPLQVSSRDELAEMAAASQGKDGRSPVAPRGADFPGSGRDGLRASQAQQCPWGARAPQGRGGRLELLCGPAAPEVRPRSVAGLEPDLPSLLSPAGLLRLPAPPPTASAWRHFVPVPGSTLAP